MRRGRQGSGEGEESRWGGETGGGPTVCWARASLRYLAPVCTLEEAGAQRGTSPHQVAQLGHGCTGDLGWRAPPLHHFLSSQQSGKSTWRSPWGEEFHSWGQRQEKVGSPKLGAVGWKGEPRPSGLGGPQCGEALTRTRGLWSLAPAEASTSSPGPMTHRAWH